MSQDLARAAYADLLAAYGTGTPHALAQAVSPTVRYVIHGDASLSGEYHGVAGMLEWINLAGQLSGGTARFRPDVVAVQEDGAEDDATWDVVAIGNATLERDGSTLLTGHIYHLRWETGVLVEGHTYPTDPTTFREAWS